MAPKKDRAESRRRDIKEAAAKALKRLEHGDEEGEGSSSKKPKMSAKMRALTLRAPSDYQTFLNGDEVSLHLIVKNAEGEEIRTIPLVKTQYSTGSFGWALSEKVVVDNGEGSDMSVALNANCVIQGSKPKKARNKD